jgi:hypothetical protein
MVCNRQLHRYITKLTEKKQKNTLFTHRPTSKQHMEDDDVSK